MLELSREPAWAAVKWSQGTNNKMFVMLPEFIWSKL